jgi:transposase
MSDFFDTVLHPISNLLQEPEPSRPIPHPPIRRIKAADLTRDQRRDIRLLHSIGWSYSKIRIHTKATIKQIRTALVRGTPQKRSGRPPILTQAQIEELIEFISASTINRRMSYEKLSEVMQFGVGKKGIRAALEREGYNRRLATRKPPISEKNRVIRLAWAQEHLNWSLEQWYQILWTDETWIIGGRHTRTWVTRKAGEEWDPTCIVERHQRKKGWMFWGCFHGHTQGPGIFWEKDWGSISKESYCAYTVPIIHGYLEFCDKRKLILFLCKTELQGTRRQRQRKSFDREVLL